MHKFGNEEITKLKFAKKQRYITADIQIPENIWQPKSKNEIRDYIAEKVRECLLMFITRLKKDKVEVNKKAFFTEVDSAIDAFKSINYESIS